MVFLPGATVTIVLSDYMVNENQGSVEVCVNLTNIPAGGLECEVVATINTSDGPKASMSFYMPQNQKLKMQLVIQMRFRTLTKLEFSKFLRGIQEN